MIWFCAVLLSALLTIVSSQMSNQSPNDANELDIDFDAILESFQEESIYLTHLNEKYIRRRATDPVADLNSNRNFDLDLETERLEEQQRIFEYIATVTNMYDLSDEKRTNIIEKLNKFPKFDEILNKCKNVLPSPLCNPLSPYRTFDGTCNNLEHPRWGALFSCDQRLLEANYKGVSDFAQSIKGGPLPHPRTLSLDLSDDAELPTMKISQLFPFFGQLLAHDMARNPPTTYGGRTFLCCPIQELLPPPPQCMPLTYPADDPYYSQFNYTCQNMLRHVPCPSCSFEKRKHLNQATSFIDCSFVYGVNEEAAKSLRTFDGTGKLLTQPGNLMPKRVKAEKDINCRMKFKKYCFESGDSRGNQHTILASLHTLFVREHNRIATEMKILNPHWDEETLFQETRKLVNAIMQSIVYKEFLPLLLGPTRMSDFDLWSNTSHYNSTVNPQQFEEFNTAAYRLHSTLNTALYENETHNVVKLRDTFMVQQPIHEGSFGKFLKGTSKFPAHKYGRHHVEDATKYLYKSPEKLFGPDIQTVNIYRGRDHGMPPYIKLLAYCTNNEVNVKTFEDLNQVMDPEEVKLLKQHYKDVADIDLIIGLQMEYNNDASVLPPTGACINAIQFKNLKEGDRFFFTHTDLPNSFSREKIEAIHNASLSRLICDNTDVKEMQENAMLTPSEDNPVVPCSSLPEIDLCLWKIEPATLE